MLVLRFVHTIGYAGAQPPLYDLDVPPVAGTIHHVISGALAGGDTFTCGYWTLPQSTPSQTELDAICGLASGALQNNLLTTTVRGLFNASTVFNDIKSYYYNGGTNAALVSERSGLNFAGTGASSPTPNQVALCVSLRSDIPGRRHRGRCYLPGPTIGILAAGQISTANAQVFADAFASMLSAMKDDPTNPSTPIIASGKFGLTTPITHVIVDTKLDVIRSRSNHQLAVGSHSSAVT